MRRMKKCACLIMLTAVMSFAASTTLAGVSQLPTFTSDGASGTLSSVSGDSSATSTQASSPGVTEIPCYASGGPTDTPSLYDIIQLFMPGVVLSD